MKVGGLKDIDILDSNLAARILKTGKVSWSDIFIQIRLFKSCYAIFDNLVLFPLNFKL